MHDDDARTDPQDEAAPRRARASKGSSFALFGEVLLVGAFVLVTGFAVVTLPASVAAGVAHLRRHVTGREDGVGVLASGWWAALKNLWLAGVLLLVAALVVALDLTALASGALPGGDAVRWVVLAAVAAAVVVLVRGLAAWSDAVPPVGVVALLRTGAARAGDDLTGSVLLVVAVGASGVLVWALLPLVVVAGGLVCVAAVAVEARRTTRAS